MKTRTTISLLLILATLGAQAAVWRVNNNPTMLGGTGNICDHCFTDLQNAIDDINVFPGDTLHLEASVVNYGDVTINKQITIIGPGYFLGDNTGEQNNIATATINRVYFVAGSSGSVLEGLTLGETYSQAVYLGGSGTSLSNVTITKCYVDGNVGFYFYPPASGNNIQLTKNYINGSFSNNYTTSQMLNLTFTNNFVNIALGLTPEVSGTVTNNIIGGNVTINSGITDFYNNICTSDNLTFNENDNGPTNVHDNIFVSSPSWVDNSNTTGMLVSSIFIPAGTDLEENLNFMPTCTVCQQGFAISGTTAMGIWGGDDPYRLAGIPGIPSIYQLNATTATYPGGDVNVQISTKTN